MVTGDTAMKLNDIAERYTHLFCYLVEEIITEKQAQLIIHQAEAWVNVLGETR